MKNALRILCLLLAAVFFIGSAMIVIGFAKYALVVGDYDDPDLDGGGFLQTGKEEYSIGRNSLEYPVFRSPKRALAAFTEEYADMIDEYASIMKLRPLSQSSYEDYITAYNSLSPKNAAEFRDVAIFASTYKTSFMGTSVYRQVAAVGLFVFGAVLLVFALPIRKRTKPAVKAPKEASLQAELVN
ncbi:MAG: hypothetical protein IKZ82_01085 [Clostridia bacterium]|nr:hypothetical protein [Clostridia bacterium]